MDLLGEAARLETLEAYALLDTPPEPELDSIARLATRSLKFPIGLVSLVDRDRQFFKARVGVDITETPRKGSFCDFAVRQRGIFVVPDATKDARFAGHTLVTGPPGLRFYAGAPLIAPQGAAIGTLCVLDTQARRGLSELEAGLLDSLGRETMALLELARERAALARLEAAVRGEVLARLDEVSSRLAAFAPAGNDADAIALLSSLAEAEAAAEDLAVSLSRSRPRAAPCDLAAICDAACAALDVRLRIERLGDCRGEWDETLLGYVIARLLETSAGDVAATVVVSGTGGTVELRIDGVRLEGRALIEEAATRVAELHGGRYRRRETSISVSLPRVLGS